MQTPGTRIGSELAPRGVPVLEVRSISKSFGAVRALSDVSFALHPGEILGLLGDNGAGKTTLVKCLAGILKPDSGTVFVHGKEVQIHDPQDAQRVGIETVHQNLALVPGLDVAANMFLNRERTSRVQGLSWIGWLSKRRMYEEAREILDRFHVRIPSVRQRVDQLSGGQRQAVAVSRAVEWGDDIVLLDEPTAALGVEQSAVILDLIRKLSEQQVAVLLISHNMQHVVDVCHRAVVLRHGEKVGDVAVPEVTATDLVDLITGATRAGPGAEEQAKEGTRSGDA